MAGTKDAQDGPDCPLRQALGGTAFDTGRLARLLLDAAAALPVPGAEDRDSWDPAAGNLDPATVRHVLDAAEADLAEPWSQPLASQAVRVHRDGDREAWEQPAFARQRRLSRAVIAAAVTLDGHWIDQVADGVLLLCEQSSWCWPAHDDAFARTGSVLAQVADPYLDLGAGEAVAQLAWTDHVLGRALDARFPGLRARIRREASTRVLEPFVRRRDWHWLGLDGDVHNWNPWIHGNVLVAALRLLDDPGQARYRAEVVRLVLDGIERYVAALPGDGATDEGYAYWWNGACRALEALELLHRASGGRLDAVPAVPALRATVAFPYQMQLGGGWYVNLADAQARPPADQPWHALYRAATRVNDDRARRHAAAHRQPGRPVATEAAGLGRLLQGLTDREWLAAEPAASPLPRQVWLPSIQVLIARERAGDAAGLALVAKGGHNGEHHNHNDVGSFIIACDGVPFVIDAGRPTYTASTFGQDRYSIWTMQSRWHNVPEIGGATQRAGRQYAASHPRPVLAADSAELILELGGAYHLPALLHWRRRFGLYRGATTPGARVVIGDSWSFATPPEGPTVVRMLVAGTVRPWLGGALVIPPDGARPVRLGWPADVAATLVRRELDDPLLADVWGEAVTRIDLTVSERTRIAVTAELDTLRNDI
jgi:hypothetical protein